MSREIKWKNDKGEEFKGEVQWSDALESRYGTALTARQVAVWESYLREMSTSGAEIIEAIEYAIERKIGVKFRATETDVQNWVSSLRNKKMSEGIQTHTDEESTRLIKSFVAKWVPKLIAKDVTVEEMEEASRRQPVKSCSIQYRMVECVMEKVGES